MNQSFRPYSLSDQMRSRLAAGEARSSMENVQEATDNLFEAIGGCTGKDYIKRVHFRKGLMPALGEPDVHAMSKQGHTLWHRVAHSDEPSHIKLVEEWGVDPTKGKITPFEYALSSNRDVPKGWINTPEQLGKFISYLLRKGAGRFTLRESPNEYENHIDFVDIRGHHIGSHAPEHEEVQGMRIKNDNINVDSDGMSLVSLWRPARNLFFLLLREKEQAPELTAENLTLLYTTMMNGYGHVVSALRKDIPHTMRLLDTLPSHIRDEYYSYLAPDVTVEHARNLITGPTAEWSVLSTPERQKV